MKNKMFKILPYNMLYSHISIMFILYLHGHPNQVDTSQVPQQNVKWMPMVEAQIIITGFRRLICTNTVGHLIILALVDVKCVNRIWQKIFRPVVWEFPKQTWNLTISKYLKSDISLRKSSCSKLVLQCNLTKVMLNNEKQNV